MYYIKNQILKSKKNIEFEDKLLLVLVLAHLNSQDLVVLNKSVFIVHLRYTELVSQKYYNTFERTITHCYVTVQDSRLGQKLASPGMD